MCLHIYVPLFSPYNIKKGNNHFLSCAGKKSGRCRVLLRVTPLTGGPGGFVLSHLTQSLWPAPAIRMILGLQFFMKNLNSFRQSWPFQYVKYFVRLFSKYSTALCLFLLRSSQQPEQHTEIHMQIHHGAGEYFKNPSNYLISSSQIQYTECRWKFRN